MEPISDREWLYTNYEQFCKNSGVKYMPGAISAHLDKLDELRDVCERAKLPFRKLAAIALGTWYDNGHLMSTEYAFENECIRLYHIHPEWFVDISDSGDHRES
jgi:hypothetical protein